MTLALPIEPQGARVSTTRTQTAYLGGTGFLLGNPRSRGWVHHIIRQELRVARSAMQKRRVMQVWRQVHYLAKPDRGRNYDPIGRQTIRLHYYLDLPCVRPAPVIWAPAACVTVRYALMGAVSTLGLQSPLQALEIARNYTADDLRYPTITDFSPAILREVVRRMREGTDWAEAVRGRVLWKPVWLLSYSDPGVGHDGGLYRGAGAELLGDSASGKQLWGWRL